MDKKEKFLQGFNEYKNIHEYFEENFNNFLNSVCEELVSYYGEEYKDIITYRLYNTNFVFYVFEEEKLAGPFEKIFDRDNLNERYKVIKKQHKKVTDYLKEIKKDVDSFNDENKDTEVIKIVNRKIYDSSKENYSEFDKSIRESYINNIMFKFGSSYAFYTPVYLEESEKVEHDIIIPLFRMTDEDLVHEMIHAIMSQDLLLINGDDPYHKTGLAVNSKDAEGLLEEWITEIEAKKINKKLKEKRIELIDIFFPKKVSKTSYDIFIPFVEDFYNYFKEILIYSRITLNKNYLLEQIDRDNYYDFMVAIVNCYRNYFEDYDFYYFKNVFEEETKKMKDSYSVLRLK